MRRSTITVTAAAVALASLLAVEARAQMPAEIRITEENDEFNWFTERTDRYYTQGARVEWLSSPRERDAAFPAGHHPCGLVQPGLRRRCCPARRRMSDMPSARTSTRRPIPRSRGRSPMTGHGRACSTDPGSPASAMNAVAGCSAAGPHRSHARYRRAGLASRRRRRSGWHDLIGAGRPNGWDNQLRNEPVLQLRYDIALRWPQREGACRHHPARAGEPGKRPHIAGGGSDRADRLESVRLRRAADLRLRLPRRPGRRTP